jgi:acyl dehydratase
MSRIRQRASEGIRVGDTFSVTRTFTENEVKAFADLSRDYNPVHFEDRWVKAKGFEDRICHGLLVAGMVTEIGGQIGWLASGMNFRFIKPVYFGDTITLSFTIASVDDRRRAKAVGVYRNQNDAVVLECEIFGILPGQKDRKILRELIEEGGS